LTKHSRLHPTTLITTTRPHTTFAAACLALLLLFPASQSRAAALSWNSVNWTAGGLSQSFDVDANNPGNDITINITGNTGFFNAGYPVDSTTIGGSANNGGTGLQGLQLYINSFTTNAQSVTITITFNYAAGVYANYTLWDVDYASGQFTDQISNITALTVSGSTIGASSVTGGAANSVTGSGTGITVLGTGTSTNDATGNALISFTTQRITQITFTYGNSSGAPADPGQQAIALSAVNFDPLPEAGVTIAALCCCGVCMFFSRGRRATAATHRA
jgi:hypothetical protein